MGHHSLALFIVLPRTHVLGEIRVGLGTLEPLLAIEPRSLVDVAVEVVLVAFAMRLRKEC